MDTQAFLGQELKQLETFKQKNEEDTRQQPKANKPEDYKGAGRMDQDVIDRIGHVQFNMGGIQVDADDMVQRIKVRVPHIKEFSKS